MNRHTDSEYIDVSGGDADAVEVTDQSPQSLLLPESDESLDDPEEWPVIKDAGGEHFDPNEPRDERGRWTEGGGGGGARPATADYRKWNQGLIGRPGDTLPRDAPMSLVYVQPPPILGTSRVGGKAGGMAADGRTNTEVGDEGEALIERDLGFRNEREDLKAGGGKRRQGKMDVRFDSTDYVFEAKTRTTYSKEYKIGMDKREIKEKREYVRKHKLKGGSMIIVANVDKGEISVYWRPGIGNFRLVPGAAGSSGSGGWHFGGKVRVKPGRRTKMMLLAINDLVITWGARLDGAHTPTP